jgi:hypothetical protein
MDRHFGGIRTLRPMEEGNGVFREEADSGAASSSRPVLGGIRSICSPLSSSVFSSGLAAKGARNPVR